ncbi:MAG TPA: hypothetical protein PLH91_03560 [Tenuifilaceae bacterium]|nr:hypothetical protein [Tenuifilaceae bacterium]HOZ15664.1 hypothetical protein [Tenuifilaceae bacterium]HPI44286.1 hypothetical protein [Tenuifilaceae bacterium]HPN22999.1 hypothetical protein [Tenuifilaceae bacterium]HPV56534.1 hypothetical protein [Tenuifilaceae bacterium]
MTNEEKTLAAIEEIGNQLNELKKTLNQPKEKVEIDLTPIARKMVEIENSIKDIRNNGYLDDPAIRHIDDILIQIGSFIERKQKETIHRVVEIKQSHWWIISIASYFILSFVICFWLVQKNIGLNEIIESKDANDFKYRYLKLKGYELNDLRKEIRNTTELIQSMDYHYSKKKDEIQNYVIKREEELRQLFEANEIAKQKEIEARKAKADAQELNRRINN